MFELYKYSVCLSYKIKKMQIQNVKKIMKKYKKMDTALF